MPNTPLPEWAYSDDEGDDENNDDGAHQGKVWVTPPR
jgi:hypothetical protein